MILGGTLDSSSGVYYNYSHSSDLGRYSRCDWSTQILVLWLVEIAISANNNNISSYQPLDKTSIKWESAGISRIRVNPLSPHDALKHHFTSVKTDLIFLQLRVLERKFPWNWFNNTWQFSLIFKPHQESLSDIQELRQQLAACGGWRWQW